MENADRLPDAIHAAFDAATQALARHIRLHWPAEGRNTDLNEVNLSLHLAAQRIVRDCLLYQEVVIPKRLLPLRLQDSKERRKIDFLAIDSACGFALAVEAKRLKSDTAASLSSQADHLLELRLPCGKGEIGPAQLENTRCFVAVFAHQWAREPAWRGDTETDADAVRNLAAFLHGARKGSRDITSPGSEWTHWALFAVRELERGAFWRSCPTTHA